MKNIIFLCVLIISVSCTPSTQYLATVHHGSPEYMASKRSTRSVNDAQFIGDLKINTTVNSKGEITIGLCDITQSLFGSVPAFTIFSSSKSASIGSVVSASASAYASAKVNIDGCLEFYFNPCCETLGLRFVLDDPLELSITGGFQANIEAFNALGFDIGDTSINFNPLNYLNLAGFSPTLGSWLLPPIFDTFLNTEMTSTKFCENLSLPGGIVELKFCVELNNFTASIFGVNVCPRITIYYGNNKLLDISYNSIFPGTNTSQCLTLSFLPKCSVNGATVPPDVIQLFKSIDVNNDFKLTSPELEKAKALLGIFSTPTDNSFSFAKMDVNNNGDVEFNEFQAYTTVQNQTFTASPTLGEPSKTYSPGDIALAVIMTMLGTGLVVAAALIIFAQYKGIIKLEWLGKVVPTNKV